MSAEVKQAVEGARGKFVTAPVLAVVQGDDRRIAEAIVKGSLADSIRLVMLLAAALALGGACCAAIGFRPDSDRPKGG